MKLKRTYDILNAGPNNRFLANNRVVSNSSYLLQIHNLVKPTREVEKNFDLAISLLKSADYEGIKKNFSSPIDVACSALRPLLRASPGNRLVIADLSAIESRVGGWVAECPGIMQMFEQGLDPYISFAVQMNPGKTYQELWDAYKAGDKQTRTENKPPVLGCSFGLGPGEITQDEEGNVVKTGLIGYAAAMDVDLPLEFAIKAVEVFRRTYKEIPETWYALDKAYAQCVEHDSIVTIGPITMQIKGRTLELMLPSGRAIHYIDPGVNWVDAVSKKGKKYRKAELTCQGQDQKTHQWQIINTRGAKIFENIVQGIARDILAVGLLRAKERGAHIIGHVHDEIILDEEINSGFEVEDLVSCMCEPIDWAPGLLLGAEGFVSEFYRKN